MLYLSTCVVLTKIIKCRFQCKSEGIMFKDRLKHEQNCLCRPIKCKRQCGMSIRFSESIAHDEFHCPNRLVACCWGCGSDSLKFRNQSVHQNSECAHRVVQCKWGCTIKNLKGGDQDLHHNFCNHRLVECTKGCGEFVKEKDKLHHELNSVGHFSLLFVTFIPTLSLLHECAQ